MLWKGDCCLFRRSGELVRAERRANWLTAAHSRPPSPTAAASNRCAKRMADGLLLIPLLIVLPIINRALGQPAIGEIWPSPCVHEALLRASLTSGGVLVSPTSASGCLYAGAGIWGLFQQHREGPGAGSEVRTPRHCAPPIASPGAAAEISAYGAPKGRRSRSSIKSIGNSASKPSINWDRLTVCLMF